MIFLKNPIRRVLSNLVTIELNACVPKAVSIQIANFKLCQYQWIAILPNLTRVTRYTAFDDYVHVYQRP
jgi:hypothetical protein